MTDGERICSTAIGWNFGDGHMHNEQLIAAMQKRCHFEPGEVRVVLIDAQPIQTADPAIPPRRRRHRRIRIAATSMSPTCVTRQPWADDIPVHVDETGSDSPTASEKSPPDREYNIA